MSNEEKNNLLKVLGAVLLGIFVLFMAFYLAMELILRKVTSPEYSMKHIEKVIKAQEKEFKKAEKRMLTENPFEPRMRPMLVNLVKENNNYKVIVDLKPLDGNDNGIDVNINKNVLTITGEFDKQSLGAEKIMHFSQTYYLDEDLLTDKITKEKKGDKYIITIPFEE